MKSLIKSVSLAGAERALLLRCGIALVLSVAIVRLLPYSIFRRMLVAPSRPLQKARAERHDVDQIAWGMSVASRFVPGSSCLSRAMAARHVLRREGHAAELRIGVGLHESVLSAHAWVESEGDIIFGTPQSSDSYVPLPGIS